MMAWLILALAMLAFFIVDMIEHKIEKLTKSKTETSYETITM